MSSSFNPSDFGQISPSSPLRPPISEKEKENKKSNNLNIKANQLGSAALKTKKESSAKSQPIKAPKPKPTIQSESKGKERAEVEGISRLAVKDVKEKKEGVISKLQGLFHSKEKGGADTKENLTPKEIAKLSSEDIAKMGTNIADISVQNLRYLKKSSLNKLTNDQIKILSQKLQGVSIQDRTSHTDLAKTLLKSSDWPPLYSVEIDKVLKTKGDLTNERFRLWHSIGADPRIDFSDPKWHLLALLTFPGIEDIHPFNNANAIEFISLDAAIIQNHEAVTFIVNQLKVPVLEQHAIRLCNNMLLTAPKGCKLPDFIKPYLNTLSIKGETLLTNAVKENCAPFVKLLKENGVSLDTKNKEGKTPLELASAEQKYTLCRVLDKSFLGREAAAVSQKPVNELESYLWGAFLNSDSRDVLQVINLAIVSLEKMAPTQEEQIVLSKLKDIKNSFQTQGSIIARQPSAHDQTKMHVNYGMGYTNYRSQQIGFSQKRENTYQSVLKEAIGNPNINLSTILGKLAASREGFIGEFRSPETNMDTSMLSYLRGQAIAMRTYKEILRNPQSENVSITSNGYQVTYKSKENQEIPLTSNEAAPIYIGQQFSFNWKHTTAEDLAILLPVMDSMFRDIRKKANPSEPMTPEIKKDIARIYWLASQATAFPRGSSQYSLETHRLCLELCGYRATPPSQEYVFADTVALSTTFEDFYANYYDKVFEGEPERIV